MADRRFHCLAALTRALLNPSEQLFLFAFDVLEVVISELCPLLFELTLDDVSFAFDL